MVGLLGCALGGLFWVVCLCGDDGWDFAGVLWMVCWCCECLSRLLVMFEVAYECWLVLLCQIGCCSCACSLLFVVFCGSCWGLLC